MNSGLIFRFLVYSAFVYVCLSLPTARKSGKQLVIAHRGASGYLPEHTHEAKVASFIMGADYLEQDVVLTKDFVPIVSHDIHLDEVTNVAQVFPERKRADGRYYAIDFTFDEIKQLEVSERFHFDNNQNAYFPLRFPLWKSHFSISSLQEEIELIQGREYCYLALKFRNISLFRLHYLLLFILFYY